MERLVFNFSGIYENEEYEWEKEGEVWNLTELQGTDGYLDPETEEYLREKVSEKRRDFLLPKIRILDNGNYHYMSKLLLETVDQPVFLIVFDHHTDMQPPALLPVLSCGSWILDSVKQLNHILGVCIIGPPEEAIQTVRETVVSESTVQISFISEEALSSHRAAEELETILRQLNPGNSVYVSFDKDVLSESVTDTNWDQGILEQQQMKELMAICIKKHKLEGLDLCGEPGRDSTESQRRISSKINQEIIRIVQDSLSS